MPTRTMTWYCDICGSAHGAEAKAIECEETHAGGAVRIEAAGECSKCGGVTFAELDVTGAALAYYCVCGMRENAT